jgi:hypothetical protein
MEPAVAKRAHPLHRLRNDRDVLDVVKLALVGEIVFLPGALDDLATLNLAVLAFGIGDVQRLLGLHDAAAPDAEDQSALGDVVQGRGFLGDAKRVRQRKQPTPEIRIAAVSVETFPAAGNAGQGLFLSVRHEDARMLSTTSTSTAKPGPTPDIPGRHPFISVARVSSPKPMRRPRKPTGRR